MHIIVNIVFSKNGILNKLYHLKRFNFLKFSEITNSNKKFRINFDFFLIFQVFFILKFQNKINIFGPSNPF